MTFYLKEHEDGYLEFYTNDPFDAEEYGILHTATEVKPVYGWNGKLYKTEADIPPKSPERLQEEIKGQIAELEAQQTPRRLREAALGDLTAIEKLQDIENEIELLRQDLNAIQED